MKRNTKFKALIAALLLFTLMPMAITPSSAMTPLPPSLLDGSPSYSASLPAECGLVIESQTITYDITEFPAYDDTEVIKGYKGSVRTEYTLYNPTDSEITVKVAFPLSRLPKYQSEVIEAENPAKYSILINGENIETDIRHCADYDNYHMNPDDFASLVSDEYISDPFCSPSMTVTKYTFKQSGVNESYAYVGFDFNKDEVSGSCLYLGRFSRAWYQDDGDCRFNIPAGENGCTYDLYVFGNDLKSMPDWKIYEDAGVNDGEEIEGNIEFVGKESLTLLDFVLEYYDESLGISQVDWFNMAAAEISMPFKNGGHYTELYGLSNGFSDYLMRGFICEITINPEERVTTTINAPVYPSVETLYNPPKFIYHHYLSKNAARLHTGQISININTPYYMLEGEGFEKTENGYCKTMNAVGVVSDKISIEQEEFIFTLCEVENPEIVKRKIHPLVWVLIIIGIPIIIVICIIDLVIRGVKTVYQWLRGAVRNEKAK